MIYLLLRMFVLISLAQMPMAEENRSVLSRDSNLILASDMLSKSTPTARGSPTPTARGSPTARSARIMECTYETDPEKTIKSEDKESCCEGIVDTFRSRWTRVLIPLSDYLRLLRRINCSQFEYECRKRVYSFSDFNKMAYERFCNETKFLDQCQDKLPENLARHSNGSSEEIDKPGTLINDLQLANLTLEELVDPCVQAALIDVQSWSKDGFFELKETEGPMCGIIWCGFPGSAFEKYEISDWTCMPMRCRANIIILMVTCGILATACVLTNVLSLVVFAENRRLRDSQGIYKISLSAADLLIGLFVFTTAIETMRKAYIQKITLVHPNENETQLPTLDIHSFNSIAYHNFVGFFTTLSTSVSVYTLMVASFDRFMVVFRPLRYNLYTAKSYAIKLCIAVWILGALFSILPIVVPSLQYKRIAGFLMSITGNGGIALLSVAFFIPIMFVIFTHIATFIFSKKNAKARPKHFPCGDKVREISVETRLARTLLIMVGAFLLCLLPLAILIPLHELLPGINVRKPEQLNQDNLTLISTLELIFCIIFASNSLWNFFIYNARSEEFRKAGKRLLIRTKQNVRSRLFRDSAKKARQRRTSAAFSNSSQVHYCHTASTLDRHAPDSEAAMSSHA